MVARICCFKEWLSPFRELFIVVSAKFALLSADTLRAFVTVRPTLLEF